MSWHLKTSFNCDFDQFSFHDLYTDFYQSALIEPVPPTAIRLGVRKIQAFTLPTEMYIKRENCAAPPGPNPMNS